MLRRLVAVGALLALLGGAGIGLAAPNGPWGAGYLPNSPVVTQDGKTVKFYDDVIKGKIVVVSFIYTTCRDICPVMTARLAQVKDKLGDLVGSRIFFVSISIDPETDTPAKLKTYAEAFQAGPGWVFLTGKSADIALLRYKLGERSRQIFEHRSDVMLGNDVTGEWAKDSAFSDLNTLALTIKAMDPDWRNRMGGPETAATDGSAARPARTVAASSTGLPGQALFIKACASCHTIGAGKRVGPDLQGLSARRERSWIVDYLTSPDAVRARNDPIAQELASTYKIRMPTLGLSANDAADLIAYVDAMGYVGSTNHLMHKAHHH